MPGECVLVAGANYPRYPEWRMRSTSRGIEMRLTKLAAGPWRAYCERRAAFVLRKEPDLRMTIFDFYSGEVVRREPGQRDWKVMLKRDSLHQNAANYRVIGDASNNPPL